MSSPLLDRARHALAEQAFSRLIGAEITRMDERGAELCVAVRDELRQNNGFVHGGVISYLADNALTYAACVAFSGPVVTSEYKINYLRPATGGTLAARAYCVHAGKTQAVTRCEVWRIEAGNEKLVAAAQGTIALLGAAPGE